MRKGGEKEAGSVQSGYVGSSAERMNEKREAEGEKEG